MKEGMSLLKLYTSGIRYIEDEFGEGNIGIVLSMLNSNPIIAKLEENMKRHREIKKAERRLLEEINAIKQELSSTVITRKEIEEAKLH